jgi:hypothetical protein
LLPRSKTVVLWVSETLGDKIFERKIWPLKSKTLTFAPPERKTGSSSEVSKAVFTEFFERKICREKDKVCIFAGPVRQKETEKYSVRNGSKEARESIAL